MLRMPKKYVQSTLALPLTSISQSRQRPVNVAQLSQKFSCFSALDWTLHIIVDFAHIRLYKHCRITSYYKFPH